MSYVLHLSILLVVAKLLEWVFEKKDIHPIIAHILTGILLGPFVLGIVEPTEDLRVLAEFGLIMMMLYMGLTSNFSAIAQNKLKATIVASLGVAFSFILGFSTVYLFGKGITAALFVGITLGNTAIEVTSGVLVRERVKREISSVLMGAAFADDIIAVYLIGLLTGLTRGEFSLVPFTVLTVKIVIFILSVLLLSELVFKRSKRFYQLIKDLHVFFTFTIVLTFALAVIAENIGLNQIIGAYLAGLTISRLRERKDPLIISRIKLNELINDLEIVLTEFFIPLFFIFVGLMFNPNISEISIPMIILLYISAVLGKLIGCGLGMKVFGASWRDSILVGIGMGGRGSLELAILKFGLESGLIDEGLFAMIVIVSMLTALTTPIFFRHAVRKLS
ncbi:sodium:proton antiporter [Thermococcus chitonophagus]|uniref:Na+/H+ antiporter n=1 Tax=Thermococcus chitonophagus TaxID=54262 RepID=A0A161K9A6_9EURY|nr:cation:proton antiporter [Thermococcus chitonophagus]ASJ16708.1 sodium:proton antiporter [Thermococcus chitonophagus]CUX77368.1 Na+/H+ antiporter [Thermococcus chitonophagus]